MWRSHAPRISWLRSTDTANNTNHSTPSRSREGDGKGNEVSDIETLMDDLGDMLAAANGDMDYELKRLSNGVMVKGPDAELALEQLGTLCIEEECYLCCGIDFHATASGHTIFIRSIHR
jgi:hypothetical protein